MLFNSYPFVFLFLPIALAGFFALGRRSRALAIAWLALASLFFYGWWNPVYVGLLLASITFNYLVARCLHFLDTTAAAPHRKSLLVLAVGANLGLLAYYKYTGFFLRNLNALAGTHLAADIVLPLGISFFTFTQIAFLVDTYRREVREFNFLHYGLFVTYFPHLIAGPILHHKEIMPQFRQLETYRPDYRNLAIGLSIFAIGLFKKVNLADGFAQDVTPAFKAASAGAALGLVDAWRGALAYTLQLYFDFSGYCDMAIGVSLLFGINLPLNFNSPYQATGIVDFWRRWHMTLSRFLRATTSIAHCPFSGPRAPFDSSP
jgi:D-alanyl-lipoteichoic acid acyltransferase DltB (MBOAT superfamily)